jgi:hypothetical protein
MRKGRLGMYVTDRDKALFDYLFLHKIATAEQIDRDVLHISYPHHVHRRLKTLVDHHYLKVTTTLWQGRPKFAYYLSQTGFERFIAERIGRQWAQLKSDSPEHDVVLVDLRKRFLQIDNVHHFITENAIEAELDCPDGFPVKPFLEMHCDGAVIYKSKGETFYFAVEYEATLKSKPRYEEHLTSYYIRTEIDGVIYIVKDTRIQSVLAKIDSHLCQGGTSKVFIGESMNVLNPRKKLIFENCNEEVLQLE